jgi:hypothetical protein
MRLASMSYRDSEEEKQADKKFPAKAPNSKMYYSYRSGLFSAFGRFGENSSYNN